MSTAIATRNGSHAPAIPEGPNLTAETMEKVLLDGDLSSLKPAERLAFYRSRCEAAKLDPRSQPFEYIKFQNKLTLYAKKTATDQLTGIHHLSVTITSKSHDADEGLYTADARVTFPAGRTVDDMGAVTVAGLRGEALANAMMKAVTKAKRRAVLSAVGLGMLDETEVETLQDAARVIVDERGEIVSEVAINPPQAPPDNGSGHGRGQYASAEDVATYSKAVRSYLDKRNAEWIDRWTSPDGEVLNGLDELCTIWQANGHLVKWAVDAGLLDPNILPEKLQARQRDNYPAVAYLKDRRAFAKELARYIDELAQTKTGAIYRKHPDLDPDQPEGPDDTATDAADDTWPEGRE